jgi:hypothetical protein
MAQRMVIARKDHARDWVAPDFGDNLFRRMAWDGQRVEYGFHRLGGQEIDPNTGVEHEAAAFTRVRHATT